MWILEEINQTFIPVYTCSSLRVGDKMDLTKKIIRDLKISEFFKIGFRNRSYTMFVVRNYIRGVEAKRSDFGGRRGIASLPNLCVYADRGA